MLLEGIEFERPFHAAVKMKKDVIVYIDPYNIPEGEKADYILITHDHPECCRDRYTQ